MGECEGAGAQSAARWACSSLPFYIPCHCERAQISRPRAVKQQAHLEHALQVVIDAPPPQLTARGVALCFTRLQRLKQPAAVGESAGREEGRVGGQTGQPLGGYKLCRLRVACLHEHSAREPFTHPGMTSPGGTLSRCDTSSSSVHVLSAAKGAAPPPTHTQHTLTLARRHRAARCPGVTRAAPVPASHQSPAAAPPCRPGKTAARAPACLVAWRNDEHLSIYRILNNEYTTMKVLACVSLHAVGAATLPMPPARRQLEKLQSNEQGFEPPTCMKSNTVGSCSCSRMASDRSGRPCVRYRCASACGRGGRARARRG